MRTRTVTNFSGLLLFAAVLIITASCSTGGDQSLKQNLVKSVTPGEKSTVDRQVKEIDAKIDKEYQDISEARDFINTTYLDLWKIQQGGVQTTRGSIAGAGPVNVEHEIIRLQADIEAAEADIARRRQRIKSLTARKSEILNQQAASCFPGETLVLTAEGLFKPIKRVKPGEMVMTFDIGAQADIPKPVLRAYKSFNNHYYLINNTIRVTAFERFLTPDGWREVMLLKPGDRIRTDRGMEMIRSLVVQRQPLKVYNLQVQDSHTFYVAGPDSALYLVHNTGGGGSGGGGGK